MSLPPPFSWSAALRTLRHPGPPPPALSGAAFILLATCLATVGVLIQLGHAWRDNPHYYFGERKLGTYLSFFNLLGTGLVAALVARRLRGTPFTRFWWTAAVGFVWLACDDLFVFHERIDRGVHALLGLDPDHPVTDRLDDLIVGAYGVAAVVLAHAYRAHLATFRWMLALLAPAFVLFALMVVVDVLHLSKTLEDTLKVVSGTLIVVGFLAAYLQTSTSGGER